MPDTVTDELLALGLLIKRRMVAPNETLGLSPAMFTDKTTRAVVELVLAHHRIALGSSPWVGGIGLCVGAALRSIERDRVERTEVEAAVKRVRNPLSRASEGSAGASDGLNLIRAADVHSEFVSWLWNGCLALGKLTLLEGDPGMSKTTLAIAIAAAISTGTALPGGPAITPANVLLATYEDGIADTIRPRLEAAGADLSKIHCIDGVGSGRDLFTIPEHLPQLLARTQEISARCVIIDPLSAALSGKVDAYKDHDIRRALAPLAKFAEETSAATLSLRHLVKAVGVRAIVAGGGSIAITAAARVVLRVDEDPNDPGRRILAVVKCNLAERAPSRAFRVDQRLVANAGVHPVISWDGESALSANDLAAARLDRVDADWGATKVDDGVAFLREWLADGPVSKKEIAQLAKAQDISPGTLDRAASKLGVIKRRSGHGRAHTSEWVLPTHITSIARDSRREGDGSDASATLAQRSPGDRDLDTSLHQRPTVNGRVTSRPTIVEELL